MLYRALSLTTGNAIINVPKGELSLQVENEKVTFNVFQALKDPSPESCHKIDTMDMSPTEESQVKTTEHPKELEKPCVIHLKSAKTKVGEHEESKNHVGATFQHYQGRMPKHKRVRKGPFRLWPSQLCYMSGKKEEESTNNWRDWNEFKSVLGWSIDDIKGQTT